MSDILSTINSPADLKKLPEADLAPLAAEIRQLIVDVVSQNAGHLAPSLGAVELTLALHRVFDTPRDKLVWDVGHQGYVHKILTGRRDRFHTIRQKGGLSGYLRIDESEYDAFGAGHASTSISAALGMAVARDAVGDDYKVVAIIGDGSMTGGMAWEAINNAGALKRDIIILLNDNRMSISPNVGALSSYFNELITSDYYNKLKDDVWDLLGKIKPVGGRMRDAIGQVDKAVKSLLVPGVVFEKLGFRYFGPVDGHDLPKLIETMQQVRNLRGPRILHVYTQKGKGVQYAEESPHLWHGVSKFDSKNGIVPEKTGPPSYTDVFGKTLNKLCERYPRTIGITAAMASGCGLKYMAETYPDRFFDVGIAEEHAVTFAAGVATQGLKPVVAIYSTFLQRGYDQVIHDVALQNLPVAFALDRGGIVGDDGATHNGVFDLSYLRAIPNMVVMAPKDEPELQRMVVTMLEHDGPIATRYPRDTGPGAELLENPKPIQIGTWEKLEAGDDLAVLATGSMVTPVLEAAAALRAEGITATVVNARFIKPMDEQMLESLVGQHDAWITVEENALAGGFGCGVLEFLEARGKLRDVSVHRMGIPDEFTEHGTRSEILAGLGLTVDDIAEAARGHVARVARAATSSAPEKAKVSSVAAEPPHEAFQTG